MSSTNLKADLDNYLSRNDKPPVSEKIKQTFTNVKVPWFNNGYTAVPTQDGPSTSASSLSSSTSSSWFSKEPENDCCPKLSTFQRITAFVICVILGLTFFTLSGLYIPVLLLKARKFSLLFTLGSLFLMFSFSFLWGPMNHLRHLFSKERMWFTTSYLGTLVSTLYFAMAAQSTPLTVVSAVLQIIALIWFLFSYIPGGHTGIKFFTQLCASSVRSTVSRSMPV